MIIIIYSNATGEILYRGPARGGNQFSEEILLRLEKKSLVPKGTKLGDVKIFWKEEFNYLAAPKRYLIREGDTLSLSSDYGNKGASQEEEEQRIQQKELERAEKKENEKQLLAIDPDDLETTEEKLDYVIQVLRNNGILKKEKAKKNK